jgi:PAS domain S-box-containing protein
MADSHASGSTFAVSLGALRTLFEDAPSLMGVVELTSAGDILHIADNAAGCRFFGVAPGSTAGKTASELGASGDTIAEWRRRYAASEDARGPIRFEHGFDAPWGGRRWLSFMVAPIGVSDEGRSRFCYVAEDATGQRDAEQSAREANARATAVLESISDAFVAVDRNWRFTYVNREAGRVLERGPNDLVGRDLWEEYPRLVGTEVERAYRTCVTERLASSVRAYDRGQERYYDVRAYPATDGLTIYFRDVTDAKQVESEREGLLSRIHMNEERYRTVLSSIDQGFCVVEVLFDDAGRAFDYRFLEANAMFERQTGFVATTGRTMRELVPDIEPHWPAIYGRVATTGEASRFVEESRALDRWFDVYAFRLGGPESRKVAILFSDITARKRAEDDLRASERRERERAEELETILRAVPAAIWIAHDTECREVVGNPEAYRLLRASVGARAISASSDSAAERPFREYSDGVPVLPDELPLQIAARTGRAVHDVELSFVFSDGVVHHAIGNATALRAPDGQARGAVAAFVDITAFKEASAELAHRKRELQMVADNTPDILARFDSSFRHVFVNAAVERATGRPRTDFLGKTNREVGMPPELCDVWEASLRTVFETGQPTTIEFPFESASGIRHFSSRCVPELGADGAVERVLSVVHDRTAEKLAELAMREADQRKDEFLAVLAHELRNPLAPIRSGLQVLALAEAGDERSAKVREMMDRQLGQMVRLIDDLLDVSRISRGKVELKRDLVDARTLVDSAVEASRPLLDAAHHALHVHMPPERLPVLADPTRITQVLTNLLNNSAKYTPDGGRIELSAERRGGDVVIRVVDNGIGIPREMLPAVFEMFTQVDRTLERTQRGLGIGLSLAKRLVEMHDGSIEGDSSGPGSGSTFTVRLPLSEGAAPQSMRTETVQPRGSSRRVLVVDDNADGAEMLAMYLELAGNATRTAFDGRRALEVAREWAPEIVFLDIGLPDKNGYEVAKSLREDPASRSAVLVALTGWGSASDKRRADEAGFDAHLTKPVDVAAVKEILVRFAGGRTAP